MTLRPKAFGSECTLSDKFLKGVANSGIIESIVNMAQAKAEVFSAFAHKCILINAAQQPTRALSP